MTEDEDGKREREERKEGDDKKESMGKGK